MKIKLLTVFLTMLVFVLSGVNAQPADWKVSSEEFEFSMPVAMSLKADNGFLSGVKDRVAVFYNGKVCGVGALITKNSAGQHVAVFTVYSNLSAVEGMNVKIYDGALQKVYDCSQRLAFKALELKGSIDSPLLFSSVGLAKSIDVYPNPFSDQLIIKGEDVERVEILDLLGKEVAFLKTSGSSSARWDGTNLSGASASEGIYIVRVRLKNNSGTRIFKVQKR
ncbi:MAG: T9SS type A sorting domain-containing protein [Cytophagales bacterium]|nr:T9SS type A sorting domain-containing protein [Cytophagales bacterium]